MTIFNPGRIKQLDRDAADRDAPLRILRPSTQRLSDTGFPNKGWGIQLI